MAQRSPVNLNLDPMSRSQSSASMKSNLTVDSTRSSTSSQRRRGLLGKIGTGVQSIFRRFRRARTTLTEMEIQILLTMTNFTREEVLQWHEKFLTDCPHGYMTRKQFIANYKSLCPKGDAERFARHVFRAFDLDKSNTVDFHEFLVGLSMTSTTSSIRDKLQWTFHVFDIDGNGLLTRRECLEVIESIVRFNQSLQGDTLHPNMEQPMILAKRSMMNIFDNVDDAQNDKLTMSQFVEGCLKDEFISRLLAPGATNTTLVNTYDIPLTSS
ncbi:unnamed protein product [Adineta steineri]|uniref:EF-hand domain-containing protein n=2 Tax=Adineta steineri TaxID=433720 RepID=A0A818H8B8_9BILA|nr:unnamed protein product [Adineta steineri]